MATLTPVGPARSANLFNGVAAAAGGDKFLNDGHQLLVFEHTNDAGADMTLTITTAITIDAEPVDDKEISIVKGNRYLIGYFPPQIYNDNDGYVNLTYSSETDIEVAVITLS